MSFLRPFVLMAIIPFLLVHLLTPISSQETLETMRWPVTINVRLQGVSDENTMQVSQVSLNPDETAETASRRFCNQIILTKADGDQSRVRDCSVKIAKELRAETVKRCSNATPMVNMPLRMKSGSDDLPNEFHLRICEGQTTMDSIISFCSGDEMMMFPLTLEKCFSDLAVLVEPHLNPKENDDAAVKPAPETTGSEYSASPPGYSDSEYSVPPPGVTPIPDTETSTLEDLGPARKKEGPAKKKETLAARRERRKRAKQPSNPIPGGSNSDGDGQFTGMTMFMIVSAIIAVVVGISYANFLSPEEQPSKGRIRKHKGKIKKKHHQTTTKPAVESTADDHESGKEPEAKKTTSHLRHHQKNKFRTIHRNIDNKEPEPPLSTVSSVTSSQAQKMPSLGGGKGGGDVIKTRECTAPLELFEETESLADGGTPVMASSLDDGGGHDVINSTVRQSVDLAAAERQREAEKLRARISELEQLVRSEEEAIEELRSQARECREKERLALSEAANRFNTDAWRDMAQNLEAERKALSEVIYMWQRKASQGTDKKKNRQQTGNNPRRNNKNNRK